MKEGTSILEDVKKQIEQREVILNGIKDMLCSLTAVPEERKDDVICFSITTIFRVKNKDGFDPLHIKGIPKGYSL